MRETSEALMGGVSRFSRLSRMSRPSDSIRVVRIIDRLNVGGPAKHVVWLTAALNHGEFDSTLVTGTVPLGEGDMGYFAEETGVHPVVIRELSRELSIRDVLVIGKLFRVFLTLRPHIIHTHKAKAGATGRVAAWLYKWLTPSSLWLRPRRCHVVHTYHGHIFRGYYGPAKTRLFLAIERVLARFATDRIITVSDRQRREIAESYRVGRPEQYRVVPLGLDLSQIGEKSAKGETGGTGERERQESDFSRVSRFSRMSRSLREEFGIPSEVPLVGFVGRLCEVKNLPLFLEAARRLTIGGVRAMFMLIGDGHLRDTLETRARELELARTVLFTGFRRDALSLYQDLDVVALTSVNEGTPLTLIEGMAAGCAVASTEVGGVADLMGARQADLDGFTVWDHGITAPSGEAETFARGLRYLLEHPALRQAMGSRGRVFVHSRLSKERLARDMESLYRELCGREAERPREKREKQEK